MRPSEYKARAAQQESDYRRWADDGGPTPEPEINEPAARPPWLAVGVAVAIGFALGWITNPPGPRGGR